MDTLTSLRILRTRSAPAVRTRSTAYYLIFQTMGRRKNDEVVREIARYTYDRINSYVPNLRTNSEHTVRAYTTAVNLYISFLESYGIKADSFTTECFSANHITDWLLWLRTKRNSSSRTCNNRLAAIKCLLKYIGMRDKAYQFLYIDASDSVKRLKEPRKQVHGMTKEAVACHP